MKKKRVLIVDDEPDILDIMQIHVTDLGYEVDIASNGEDACQMVLQCEYEFVITDLDMPKMNGVDLINFIRQQRPYMPIAICSGRISEFAERLVLIAANVAISKPFKLEVLKNAVESLQGVSDQVSKIKEFIRPIRISDVMCPTPLSVLPTTPTKDAIELMESKKIGALMVLEGSILRGIFSERDVLHHVAKQTDRFLSRPISDFMTTNLILISPSESIEEADRLMTTHHIRHLPVISDGQLVGMISLRDVSTFHVNRLDRKLAAKLVSLTTQSTLAGAPVVHDSKVG